jgi:hypothetical protein
LARRRAEGEGGKRASRTPKNTSFPDNGFYAPALRQEERDRLPLARQLEGLDEEIALLRVRLASMAREQPEDMDTLIKGVGMLVRAVATKYRLSKKAEDDLYQSMLGVLRGIGDALLPEGFDGGAG